MVDWKLFVPYLSQTTHFKCLKMNATPDPVRWYVIINPAAGSGLAGRRRPLIEQTLQALGLPYTVKFTDSRGHATRLAEDGILKGYRHILGVGGDGTNHEIVNGIVGQALIPSRDVTYALMPVGTGNDWARTYRLSHDPAKRLAALVSPQTVLQDVGLVEYQSDGERRLRYFVNVAGMAYDAYLVQQLEQHPRQSSRFLYLGLILRYLFKYRIGPARIRFNDQIVEDDFYTINLGICPYSGGGMRLVPQAVPDDGLLALTFARSVSKLDVILQTGRFYNGTILNHPLIEGFQSAGPVTVEPVGNFTTLLEADGELLGQAPATFTVVEKALRVAK